MKRTMKRTMGLLLGAAVLIAAILFIRGGSSKENTAFSAYKTDAPGNAVAVIVNNPDATMASNATKLYVADMDGEKLLIIPRYAGSTVSVEPVTLQGEHIVMGTAVLTAPKVPEKWALLLTAIRSEGIPLWQVTVSGPKGNGSYLISYNGETGTPPVEYITKQ